jgi:hypothetical protein
MLINYTQIIDTILAIEVIMIMIMIVICINVILLSYNDKGEKHAHREISRE